MFFFQVSNNSLSTKVLCRRTLYWCSRHVSLYTAVHTVSSWLLYIQVLHAPWAPLSLFFRKKAVATRRPSHSTKDMLEWHSNHDIYTVGTQPSKCASLRAHVKREFHSYMCVLPGGIEKSGKKIQKTKNGKETREGWKIHRKSWLVCVAPANDPL